MSSATLQLIIVLVVLGPLWWRVARAAGDLDGGSSEDLQRNARLLGRRINSAAVATLVLLALIAFGSAMRDLNIQRTDDNRGGVSYR